MPSTCVAGIGCSRGHGGLRETVMGVAALVLGILGLVGSMVPFFGAYAIVLTGLALLFGFVGLFIAAGRGMAIAGFVCGLVGTAISVYWILVVQDVAAALQPVAIDSHDDARDPRMKAEERGGTAPAPRANVAKPRRCTIGIAASGITVNAKRVTREQAIAACKGGSGAEVMVAGDAKQGDWDALEAALGAAGITIFRVQPRPQRDNTMLPEEMGPAHPQPVDPFEPRTTTPRLPKPPKPNPAKPRPDGPVDPFE